MLIYEEKSTKPLFIGTLLIILAFAVIISFYTQHRHYGFKNSILLCNENSEEVYVTYKIDNSKPKIVHVNNNKTAHGVCSNPIRYTNQTIKVFSFDLTDQQKESFFLQFVKENGKGEIIEIIKPYHSLKIPHVVLYMQEKDEVLPMIYMTQE